MVDLEIYAITNILHGSLSRAVNRGIELFLGKTKEVRDKDIANHCRFLAQFDDPRFATIMDERKVLRMQVYMDFISSVNQLHKLQELKNLVHSAIVRLTLDYAQNILTSDVYKELKKPAGINQLVIDFDGFLSILLAKTYDLMGNYHFYNGIYLDALRYSLYIASWEWHGHRFFMNLIQSNKDGKDSKQQTEDIIPPKNNNIYTKQVTGLALEENIQTGDATKNKRQDEDQLINLFKEFANVNEQWKQDIDNRLGSLLQTQASMESKLYKINQEASKPAIHTPNFSIQQRREEKKSYQPPISKNPAPPPVRTSQQSLNLPPAAQSLASQPGLLAPIIENSHTNLTGETDDEFEKLVARE